MRCGWVQMAAVSFGFQRQRCSVSPSTELPADCARITSTRSLPIAKVLYGLALTAASVVTIHMLHVSKQLATTPTATTFAHFSKQAAGARLPGPIADCLLTTINPRHGMRFPV